MEATVIVHTAETIGIETTVAPSSSYLQVTLATTNASLINRLAITMEPSPDAVLTATIRVPSPSRATAIIKTLVAKSANLPPSHRAAPPTSSLRPRMNAVSKR